MGMIKTVKNTYSILPTHHPELVSENTQSIPNKGDAFWVLKIYHRNQMTISMEPGLPTIRG